MKDMEKTIPYKIIYLQHPPSHPPLTLREKSNYFFIILWNNVNYFSGCLVGSNLSNLNKDKTWTQKLRSMIFPS